MPRRGRHPTKRRRDESDEFREANAKVSCWSKLGEGDAQDGGLPIRDAIPRMGAPGHRALDRRVVRGHCVAATQCPRPSPVESREEPRLTIVGRRRRPITGDAGNAGRSTNARRWGGPSDRARTGTTPRVSTRLGTFRMSTGMMVNRLNRCVDGRYPLRRHAPTEGFATSKLRHRRSSSHREDLSGHLPCSSVG